jgi:hypothetical protein
VLDSETAADLFKYSTMVTGAEWPPANQPKSPCPTLKVIGAVTAFVNAKEEAKRMEPKPGMVAGAGKLMGGTAAIADTLVGGTVGQVAKFAQSKVLGSLPEEAVTGSFQESKLKKPKLPRFERVRRVFRRRKSAPSEPEAVALAVAEEDADELGEIEARIDAVLDGGGMPVPTAPAKTEQEFNNV